MAAPLPLIITTLGKAALVNAANTGTNAIVIAQVGVSPTAIAATAATTAIAGELKRLSTIAGQVVADDVFHVAIADNSADTYALRTIGLYLDTGVLFAVYSQADLIAEKASPAGLLLNGDIKLASPLATSIEFGDSSFVNPPATETVVGVLRLATPAEAIAGINATRGITPATLLAALNARLGDGAPSVFVKTLLTAASAATLRALLAIKGAALKEEGAGNGLDADLLDGQHGVFYRAWANLTGVPGSFTPTAHTHDAGDTISGVFNALRIPDLAMARITGLAAALADKASAAHTHAMADIVGLASALAGKAAAAHTHVMSEITGLSDALAAKAAAAHTHAMADIIGLAAALAGKSNTGHGHVTGDIAGLDAALAGKSSVGHGHSTADIAGLDGALAGKSNVGHGHSTADIAGLDAALAGKAPSAHTHDWSQITNAKASAAEFRANSNDKALTPNGVWAAAQLANAAQAATIAIDLSTGFNFETTMTGNRTLGAPANAKPGQSGTIVIVQDGTGGRALAYNAAWKFAGGVVPALSGAAGARDVLVFTVISAGVVVASLLKDVR